MEHCAIANSFASGNQTNNLGIENINLVAAYPSGFDNDGLGSHIVNDIGCSTGGNLIFYNIIIIDISHPITSHCFSASLNRHIGNGSQLVENLNNILTLGNTNTFIIIIGTC